MEDQQQISRLSSLHVQRSGREHARVHCKGPEFRCELERERQVVENRGGR